MEFQHLLDDRVCPALPASRALAKTIQLLFMSKSVNTESIVTIILEVDVRGYEDDRLGCDNATVSHTQQMSVHGTTDTETNGFHALTSPV